MTIPRTPFDPAAYGLPGEAELAAWAAAYFPEFTAPVLDLSAENGETPNNTAGAYGVDPGISAPGNLLRGGVPAVPEPGAVSPVVIPQGAEPARGGLEFPPAAPERGVPAAGPGDPSLSRYIGPKSLAEIRADFPILAERVNGHDLVWLDNAATTQKPQAVIDRLVHFYRHENSNVHRGVHELADRSTNAYEEARLKTARFIGAASADNIVFVRGTTEGINLAAQGFVKPLLRPGDEIVLTMLEHHANIVPWQIVAEETGALLRVAPIDETGQIILPAYEGLFSGRTRFVSLTQVSNALGTIAPVEEMIRIAHARGVPVLVDGAQSAAHLPVNVSALDADFFVFSGHKIFGPTGIGALYGKSALLEAARPYQGGGNMIADVTFARTLYQKAPAKFEAGTGNIAGAVGLGAALDYVSALGMEHIAAWERELVRYGTEELAKVPGLRLVGTAARKAGVFSFVLAGRDNGEVGKRLNRRGIAVRAGHHCAQPGLRFFGLEGTVRPSLAFYNTFGDIDRLTAALREIAG
ncbi:MAG: cysteine desulfurase [Treponema sp.]|jgi:cysteine desulfurase/selenocysteine lyase|nr:cysteine desulfurase [Treponema sp.]